MRRKKTKLQKYEEHINAEFAYIQFFVVEVFKKNPRKQLLMRDIFEGYKIWRKYKQMPETALSIDSFGRLFPEDYRRVTIRKEKYVGRAVVGIEFDPLTFAFEEDYKG